ncbi:O-antigen polymerase [Clostridium sp. HCS.1]|uniref:O-antigen polymerase n=1 Tax=Clostridium sp. HCS.1 TaxID=3238594 RepID=UPI003A0FCB76
MIYILFGLFFLMLIYLYLRFNRDLIQPSVIFCLVYCVSIFCAILNVSKWNIQLEMKTFLILFLGAVEFIIISLLVNKHFEKNSKSCEVIGKNRSFNIEIEKYKVFIITVYNVIMIGLLLYYVLNIASQFGEFNSLSEALTLFKQHTSYAKDAELPHLLLFAQKPIIVFAYIFMYLYIKNIIFDEENSILYNIFSKWYYLIPVVGYIIHEFINSNRLTILSLGFATFTITLILYNIKNNWKKPIKMKSIITIGIIGILVLVIFYLSASWVGRINNKNLIDYITLYCGGSIENLNLFIKSPPEASSIWGKESFYYLIKNLHDYGIMPLSQMYPIHLEFRYYDSIMIGNVYTAYRRWIYDFGIVGMIILQGIMALFFNVFYNKIKYSASKYLDFYIIIFSYMIYSVFLHPIDSYFYLQTVRLAFVSTFVLFILIYMFIFKFHITLKKGLTIRIGNYYIFFENKLVLKKN